MKKNNKPHCHASASILTKIAVAACAAFVSGTTFGAPAIHVIKNDFRALIRAGADSPDQFAVAVPHKMSINSGGVWTTERDHAVWKYAVRLPSAVSMSFHARAVFPKGTTLTVAGTKNTTSYAAANLHRGQLWSRIQPGDSLEFRLAVPLAERSKLQFALTSVQAGYRSIGPGVSDHPYYLTLKEAQVSSSGTSSCIRNYECSVTAGNTPVAAATAAVVVQNLYQCTGTLINNVVADNTPYMLTARHCQTGKLGGGNPGIAEAVTVYWNATSACGTQLESLYDGSVPSQTGATTVVEQQDAWLIKLTEIRSSPTRNWRGSTRRVVRYRMVTRFITRKGVPSKLSAGLSARLVAAGRRARGVIRIQLP